jgi:hypothetical protein
VVQNGDLNIMGGWGPEKLKRDPQINLIRNRFNINVFLVVGEMT